jgi:phage-related protein
MVGVDTTQMDREKLKLLVRNLELLVDSLKAEVYSDTQSYLQNKKEYSIHDYDEIFDDDDGYPD